MSTLNEKSSIGQIVGYSLICGLGFGAGTQLSMIIAQAGLSAGILPTVTAWISSTPNLGGVLGVGIIGTIINNTFREHVSSVLGDTLNIPINDAVTAARDPKIGHVIVDAYVRASSLGFKILAGIAVLQFVLCLGLREVVLDDGTNAKNEGQEIEMGDVGKGDDKRGETGVEVVDKEEVKE